MLPEQDVIVQKQPGLLFEDDFNNGPAGWVQLMTETQPSGPLLLDNEIAYSNSRYSLLLSTEDYTDVAGRVWGGAMAVKRIGRPSGARRVYMEYQWAWGSTYGENTPRAFDFGLDTADSAGVRTFFRVRFLNYDEATGTRVHKWQLEDKTAGFVDIPGADIDVGYNENKRNLCRLEMSFDLQNAKYDGVRVDGHGFGSLAAAPDTSLQAYGPTVTTLLPFANGFNPIMEIRNRLNTASTRSWANLAYARGVAL